MINIITITNADSTKILNAIKDMFDWYDVTMDGDNVTSIDITSKISIAYSSATALLVTDTNISGSSQSTTISSIPTTVTIVQTDNSIFCVGPFNDIFIIDKTEDLDGNISSGIIACSTNSSSALSDTTVTIGSISAASSLTSRTLTQLIPIAENHGECHFQNSYFTFMLTQRATSFGKITLAGKNYYLGYKLGIEYVP